MTYFQTTGKSGNILISGRTLKPVEYRTIAPYLGKRADERVHLATKIRSVREYQTQLEARPTEAMVRYILNSPCNQSCSFCLFEPDSIPKDDLDWDGIEKRVLATHSSGIKTKVYPKEFNPSAKTFQRVLHLMNMVGESYATTNGLRGFNRKELEQLAASTIQQVIVSFLPQSLHQSAYGNDHSKRVARTIRSLTEFSSRPFRVGLFSQVFTNRTQAIIEAVDQAVSLGVDSIEFRRTLPLGKATHSVVKTTSEQIDQIILAIINARIKYPKDKIKIHLDPATFGPNYYYGGMFRYQLGNTENSFFGSRYPCPFLDSKDSYAILLPEERYVFCTTLVAKGSPEGIAEAHIKNPSKICSECDVLDICKGGCVASRLSSDGELSVCLTHVFKQWEQTLL